MLYTGRTLGDEETQAGEGACAIASSIASPLRGAEMI